MSDEQPVLQQSTVKVARPRLAEIARRHADAAARALDDPYREAEECAARASVAAAYASLAVAEELGRFEAVAVEERTP